MKIALTGTPGAGKTTVARALASMGHTVIDGNTWFREQDLVAGHDALDRSDAIDIEAGRGRLPDGIFDSHLGHLLAPDVVWLVRCDPALIRQRLSKRGYHASKIQENVEAEAMDLILQEALGEGVPVVQRDGSRRSPEALASAFVETQGKPLKGNDIEEVDWSDSLLG